MPTTGVGVGSDRRATQPTYVPHKRELIVVVTKTTLNRFRQSEIEPGI
jgi:hypothetical protein